MKLRIGLIAKLCLTGVMLATIAASPANALDVSITGLRNSHGDVVVCVWRAEDKGFPNCGSGSPWKKLSAPASNPRVTFGDLPPIDITVFGYAKRAADRGCCYRYRVDGEALNLLGNLECIIDLDTEVARRVARNDPQVVYGTFSGPEAAKQD